MNYFFFFPPMTSLGSTPLALASSVLSCRSVATSSAIWGLGAPEALEARTFRACQIIQKMKKKRRIKLFYLSKVCICILRFFFWYKRSVDKFLVQNVLHQKFINQTYITRKKKSKNTNVHF